MNFQERIRDASSERQKKEKEMENWRRQQEEDRKKQIKDEDTRRENRLREARRVLEILKIHDILEMVRSNVWKVGNITAIRELGSNLKRGLEEGMAISLEYKERGTAHFYDPSVDDVIHSQMKGVIKQTLMIFSSDGQHVSIRDDAEFDNQDLLDKLVREEPHPRLLEVIGYGGVEVNPTNYGETKNKIVETVIGLCETRIRERKLPRELARWYFTR